MKDPTRYTPDDPEAEQAATEALIYSTLSGVQTALSTSAANAMSGKRIEDLASRTVGKRLLRQTERIVLTIGPVAAGVDLSGLVRAAFFAAFPTGFQPFNNDSANPGAFEDLILGGAQVEITAAVSNGVYDTTVESRALEKACGQWLSLAEFPSNDQRNPLVEFTEAQHLAQTHPLPPVPWVDRKATLMLEDNGSGAMVVYAGILCNASVAIQVHGDFWTPEYFAEMPGGAQLVMAARKMIKG